MTAGPRAGAGDRQGLELHDDIVQGLTAILWALEAGACDHARALATSTLARTQEMVGRLLAERPDAAVLGPGSLRRTRAAG